MNAYTHINAQADSTVDVTDAWNEQTDPENARGDSATALFDHDSAEAFHPSDPRPQGEIVSVPILTGLHVETDGGAITYPREWVLTVFGSKWVSRMEDEQYEAINGL